MKKNILLKISNITQYFTDKKKVILFISGIILLGSTNILPTSALEYQNSQLVSFTIDPTVQITISDNLTIPSLSPGDSKDSNIITVTASSNAIAGYTLSSTVGSSTGNSSTELRKDGTSTTHKFDSITTNKPSLSDFTGNDWGYSYSTDSGTTWQSGDITGTPASGYNGLPLYTTDSPITLINSNDASTNSIQFKIGAKATSTQVAGEYTNVINFIGVANANPDIKTLDQVTYMQDGFSCVLTPEGTTKTLIDRRDNSDYVVKKINGQCWMTQNLRIMGTISAEYSNFEGEDFNVSEYSLDANDSSYLGYCNGSYGYNYACAKNSGNIIKGAWYNFCAASAGTVCRSQYDKNTTNDICPYNWRLPNTYDFSNINNVQGINNFTPSAGGYYGAGELVRSEWGTWWESTLGERQYQQENFYSADITYPFHFGSFARPEGHYVRCVHD